MPDSLTPGDIEEAAETLDALLAQVDSGAIDADPSERAYLAGSRDTLRRLGHRKHEGTS